LGKDGHTAANDRIVVGAIGCGVRGRQLVSAASWASDCRIVAVCDVRRPRLLHIQELCNRRFGASAEDGSDKSCRAYHEYHDLLAREDIDAVILAPPDHWHGVNRTRFDGDRRVVSSPQRELISD